MNNKGFVSIVLVVIAVAVIATAGYFVFLKKSWPVIQKSDAKIYTNTYESFSFQFPEGFEKSRHDFQSVKSSEVFFTNYGEPDVSGLPPFGKAHIAYGSWQDEDGSDFEAHISGRSSSPSSSKTETTLMGMPAIRIVSESPTNTNPVRIEREISYFVHRGEKSHQFFLEYFKDDPHGSEYEKSFEAMMSTVEKL